uniref:Uncharacterized protein n=1 Tax=Strix occidentalis caurina TaxID=311401 RepID=A0A8D0FDD5_STROC
MIVSYLSACVSLAGFGNLMQDVLWCFSQVKGTIDIGVTEGKFIFPFVAVIKNNLFPSGFQLLFTVSGNYKTASLTITSFTGVSWILFLDNLVLIK